MLYSRSLPTVAAVLALAAAASAQVGTFYTFSQSVGAYTPITGGTLIATATSANTLDDNTYSVVLPIPFTYDSAVQTQVQVQTNGHLAFGAVSPGTTYTPLSSTAVTPGFVSACGRDLQGGYVFACDSTIATNTLTNVSATGPLQIGDVIVRTGVPTGTTILGIVGNVITMSANATSTNVGLTTTCYGPWSEMRWELVGSSPNQEVVFQWSNFRRFSTSLTINNGTFFNFQIRLHENGEIRCVYGNCSPGVAGVTTTALHQVGLRGPTNAFPANINDRMNTKGVNDDWSLSAAGTTNAVGMLFNTVAPANVIPNGLTYTWSPPVGVIATNTTIGQGCGSSFASFYQNFTTASSMNLGGTAITMVGSPYAVAPGVGALLPVGGTPTTLVLSDDSEAIYTFVNGFTAPGWGASVAVCSNGFVSKATGNGTSFTPTPSAMLAGPQDWYALGWHDLNPSIVGSGQVKVDESPTLLVITYDGVWDYSGASAANANTMQMQVTSSGDVTYAYGTMSALGGTGFVVGYSPAGPNLDPGSRTLLSSPAFALASPEVLALALTASDRPVQMAGPNTWDLVVSNIPATTVIGADIFGLSDPGILDLGLFGLAKSGCQLRANLDLLNAWISTGVTHNYSLVIPPSPSLNNFVLYTQSVCLGNGSMADNITSNGIRGVVGNL
jgi:hypothetical protein